MVGETTYLFSCHTKAGKPHKETARLFKTYYEVLEYAFDYIYKECSNNPEYERYSNVKLPYLIGMHIGGKYSRYKEGIMCWKITTTGIESIRSFKKDVWNAFDECNEVDMSDVEQIRNQTI